MIILILFRRGKSDFFNHEVSINKPKRKFDSAFTSLLIKSEVLKIIEEPEEFKINHRITKMRISRKIQTLSFESIIKQFILKRLLNHLLKIK